MRKEILILLLMLISIFTAMPISFSTPMPERYIVVFDDERIPSDAQSLIKKHGGDVLRTFPDLGILIAESTSANFKNDLANEQSIKFVALDRWTKFIPCSSKGMVFSMHDDSASAVGSYYSWEQWSMKILNPAEEYDNSASSDDPYYDLYQWNMKIINATEDKAWTVTTGTHEVKVAILDTGVAYDHPDIAPNYDFELSTYFIDPEIEIAFLKENPEEAPYIPTVISEDEYDPALDYNGHGTWCAGAVAAAWNGWGVIGVAPDVTIVNVKVMIAEGWGYWSWLLEGIYYLAHADIDIGSMSLGGYVDLSQDWGRAIYEAMLRATSYAYRHGVLLVAAAGNEGLNLDLIFPWQFLPAQLPTVVGVSGITHNYTLSPISNYGYSVVEITAPMGYWYGYPEPGWWLYLPFSTWSPHCWRKPGYYFAWMDGTSAATPHVAGVAGLILSLQPDFSPTLVRVTLGSSACDLGPTGFDPYFGYGLIDAYSAVTLVA